ncbi:MAG: glycerophosphodiester phosphodiesterase family protein [Beijerinckiaceae bacterium]
MAVHHPIIAAHRGGALLWPENSMTAFRGALTLPIDQIETDVRLSQDGQPFILHDATLDRTTEATGIASDLSWKYLEKIRLKRTWQDTVPHLHDLLKLLKPTAVDLRLELKANAQGDVQPRLAEVALATVAWHGMLLRTTVTSFDISYMAQVADTAVAGRIWLIRRKLLADRGLDWVIGDAMAVRIPEIALHIADCGTLPVESHRHGLPLRIGFFAVNDETAIASALKHRASAFTTDRPDLAVAATKAALLD